MRVTSHNVHSTTTSFQLFREQLANLLATAFDSVDSSEESLKEAVRRLAVDSQENRVVRSSFFPFCLFLDIVVFNQCRSLLLFSFPEGGGLGVFMVAKVACVHYSLGIIMHV